MVTKEQYCIMVAGIYLFITAYSVDEMKEKAISKALKAFRYNSDNYRMLSKGFANFFHADVEFLEDGAFTFSIKAENEERYFETRDTHLHFCWSICTDEDLVIVTE